MTLDPRRTGRITGSRIAAVLGLNPYNKRADVLREMVREHFNAPREFEGNAATEYGKRMEPQALAQYEADRGVMTYGGDTLHIHPVHDFLAVTPDGFVADDGLVECKAPFRGGYTHHDAVPYYLPQMHLQMACTGRQWCDFVVLQRDGSLHVSRLDYNPTWLAEHLPALEAFMADFAAAIASDEAAAPHLAERERADGEWKAAAAEWRDANAALETAKAMEATARERLTTLANGNATGCGVTVTRIERAGAIAYAKAVKDLIPDADLSAYAGKSSTYYTVKELAQ